jgi:hypothetical protein
MPDLMPNGSYGREQNDAVASSNLTGNTNGTKTESSVELENDQHTEKQPEQDVKRGNSLA